MFTDESQRDICIVIPLYKVQLDEFEQISICQLFSVLGKMDIYFAVPNKLNLNALNIANKLSHLNYKVERFSDSYFYNTRTYSELLLSPLFYERFLDYKYMLIHQTDAFVFSDKVKQFIPYDYDYIGAPWSWDCFRNFPVGNGGLSLRKICKCIELTNRFDEISKNNPYKNEFINGEDVFFSYCGADKEIDFSVPEPNIACLFSVQDDSYEGINNIRINGLPFGIHHFPKWNYGFWKPVIETFGYSLPDEISIKSKNTLEEKRQHRYEIYVEKQLYERDDLRTFFLDKIHIKHDEKVSLWGCGKDGERIGHIIMALGLSLVHLYDKTIGSVEWSDIVIKKPEKALLQIERAEKNLVIISSRKYEKDIQGELEDSGIKNYINCSEFLKAWESFMYASCSLFPKIKGVTRQIKTEDIIPLVSVVIPCFNIEEYIEKCLNCLVNQTYRNIELICVDDGSTDETAERIEEYRQADKRIKIIRQENQYAGVARNNGLKLAKGKYVLFFDGDDYCDTNMLTEMVASAERYDSDIVVCDVKNYDNLTGVIDESVPYLNMTVLRKHDERGVVSYKDVPDTIFTLASSGPWNKLYRRNFIEKKCLEFQESKRDNDEYFVLLSMALAERISWVPKKLVTYRINNPNSLQGFGEKTIDMTDMLSTVRALKKGLIENKRYDLVKDSMKNQILIRYVGLIDSQRSWRNFKHAFDTTKNVVFTEFEIDIMKETDIQACRKELKIIMQSTAEEYMFWLLNRVKLAGGERYVFPFECVVDCKRIGVYGAGKVGKAYIKQIENNNRLELVGWYDRDASRYRKDSVNVLNPDEIDPTTMDKVVIAVESYKSAEDIRKFLISKGFQNECIVWDA